MDVSNEVRRDTRRVLIDALCRSVTNDDAEVVRRVLVADRHAAAIAAELQTPRGGSR